MTLLDSWATVVCFDMASKRWPCRFRHMAGAIATSAGWMLSWTCKGSDAADGSRLSNDPSAVYLQSIPIHFFPSGEPPRRWQLSSLTTGNTRRVAAVCASASRRTELRTRFGSTLSDTWLWSGAGNPMGPALLAGELGGILEPVSVSLHDSAFLIPFELLGGQIITQDGHQTSALEVYESNATNVDEKPMPPFLAYKDGQLAEQLGIR